MNSKLTTVSNAIAKIVDLMILVAFCSLIVSCIVQVFMRSVLNDSPAWTEELARYSFIYVNMLGAVACLHKQSHARVTVIVDAVGEAGRKVLNVISDMFVLFSGYVMLHYGIVCVIQVAAQRSPAMRICMSFVYACVPLAGLFIIAEQAIKFCLDVGLKKEKGDCE